jgi:cytoplasmic iron level regulating protein YaaA (DUF328/UPF0246 family)
MKIIVSPSKTQKPDYTKHFEDADLLFPKQHQKLVSLLKKQRKTDIATVMNLNKDLLDQTYKNIKDYKTNIPFQAFYSFDGLVFKNLDKANYKEAELAYIKKHVVVLDAFYGILEPGTLIKPYRLDMKMNFGLNLYKHWDIDSYFNSDLVINLASEEFSKILHIPLVTISFLQYKNGKYINQATFSKMARGKMLDYLIKNKIDDLELIKQFKLDNYRFNLELSTKSLFVFTR